MTIKIRKELQNIINLHEKIINVLQSQKIRQVELFDRYHQDIQKEIEKPANAFLNWIHSVKPYIELVISSKLVDDDLMSQFKAYIKDILAYEQNYIITEHEIQSLEFHFDQTVETVLRLEKAIMDLKSQFNTEITKLLSHTIKINLDSNSDAKKKRGICNYCGIRLDPMLGDTSKECHLCKGLPDQIKRKVGIPVLEKKKKEIIVEPEEEVEEKEPELSLTEDESEEKSADPEPFFEKAEDLDENSKPKDLKRVKKKKKIDDSPKAGPEEIESFKKLLSDAKKKY